MNTLTTPTVNNTPRSSRENQVVANIIKNKLTTSDGLRIEETTNGTIINPSKRSYVYDGMQPPTEWSASADYSENDVVRVFHGYDYYDYNDELVTVTPGVWVCVAHVPDQQVSDEMTAMYGIDYSYKEYYRIDNINYNPIWPEKENTATLDTPDGCYWRLIGMMPKEMIQCVDGVTSTIFVGMIPSGSV